MKLKYACALCAAVSLAALSAPVLAQAASSIGTEEQQKAAREAKFKAMDKELHPQMGKVAVAAANATLDLGKNYYFLPAAEAKRVLTEGWGNAPEQVSNVVGMVFPVGKTFHDETWGAVIEYEDTGHVSDKDAASQDYDAVLASMRESEDAANKAAAEQGYAGSHLLGWAQAPTYDPATKTLIWARNIKFDGQEESTLNYDVRTLGRNGVLSVNMVDSMANLASVREAAKGLGSTVQFASGSAYNDFNPSTDKLADYGLAGLVAAGAGVAVAKKAGLLAILAIFFKKALALVIAGAVALGAWIKRKFGRGYQEEAFDEEPAAE